MFEARISFCNVRFLIWCDEHEVGVSFGNVLWSISEFRVADLTVFRSFKSWDFDHIQSKWNCGEECYVQL